MLRVLTFLQEFPKSVASKNCTVKCPKSADVSHCGPHRAYAQSYKVRARGYWWGLQYVTGTMVSEIKVHEIHSLMKISKRVTWTLVQPKIYYPYQDKGAEYNNTKSQGPFLLHSPDFKRSLEPQSRRSRRSAQHS